MRSPCIKVSTNTAIYEHMIDDMDVNAGTVVDGSETLEQVGYLRVNACDELQGYLLSKPISADEMSRFLRLGRARRDGEIQMIFRRIRNVAG